jgi:hypothetical protein
MNVAGLCQRNVITVGPSDELTAAAQLPSALVRLRVSGAIAILFARR